VPGDCPHNAFDTAAPTPQCSLAVAVVRAVQRTGSLAIGRCQRGLFESVVPGSTHVASWNPRVLRATQELR
jgi:hypothetical protein